MKKKENDPNDSKLLERRERNRISARKSIEKKKQRMLDLEKQNELLLKQNENLKARMTLLENLIFNNIEVMDESLKDHLNEYQSKFKINDPVENVDTLQCNDEFNDYVSEVTDSLETCDGNKKGIICKGSVDEVNHDDKSDPSLKQNSKNLAPLPCSLAYLGMLKRNCWF